MEPGGRLRIYLSELFNHRFNALTGSQGFQLLPTPGGGAGGKGVAPDESVHVKPGAAYDDGRFPPAENILHNGVSHGTVPADGKVLPGLRHREHMVGDSLLFFRSGLGGADVHVLVNLHGVAGDDFTVHFLGQQNGQGGFSRGGGACNGYDLGQWGTSFFSCA